MVLRTRRFPYVGIKSASFVDISLKYRMRVIKHPDQRVLALNRPNLSLTLVFKLYSIMRIQENKKPIYIYIYVIYLDSKSLFIKK